MMPSFTITKAEVATFVLNFFKPLEARLQESQPLETELYIPLLFERTTFKVLFASRH